MKPKSYPRLWVVWKGSHWRIHIRYRHFIQVPSRQYHTYAEVLSFLDYWRQHDVVGRQIIINQLQYTSSFWANDAKPTDTAWKEGGMSCQ